VATYGTGSAGTASITTSFGATQLRPAETFAVTDPQATGMVGLDQDTAYDVAAPVGASQATAFDVPAPIGADLVTALDVAAPVGAHQATALDVAAPVGANLVTALDVAAPVGANLATAYDVASNIPILVGAGTQFEGSGSGGTFAVPYPASGIVNGDVALMYWSQNSATVPADQTGWTTVQKGSATGNTLTPNLYVGVRVCDGTENGTSFTAAGSNTATLAQISVFRNIDVTTLVEASTLNGTVTATTCTLTGVTTSAAPGLLFYAAAQASTTATATPPSVPAAFTELLDRTSGVRSANAGYLIWSGSGATGDPVVTWTTSARTFGALLSLPHTIARTAVGTQQDTAYDVAAAVGASQATAFNVPAPVGSSQATALDVAAPVGASQATALDVAAPVGASSSTAYDVAAAVGASRATVFDLSAPTGTSQATVYDVSSPVGVSAATSYDVAASVGQQRATAYDVAQPPVGVSRDTAFDIASLQLVAGTSQATTYDVASVVGVSVASSYNVAAPVGVPLATVYDVATPAGASVTTTVDLAALVARSQATALDVLTSTGVSQSTSYDMEEGRRVDLTATVSIPRDRSATVPRGRDARVLGSVRAGGTVAGRYAGPVHDRRAKVLT